jgi:hypothetical protein
MIYTAPFVVLLMRANPLLGQVGGDWTERLFWAPNGTRRTARCNFTGPQKVSISAISSLCDFSTFASNFFGVFGILLPLFPTVLYFLDRKLSKIKLYLLPTVYCMIIFIAVYTHRMFLLIHFSVLQCRMTLSVCPSPSRWNLRRFDKGRRR